MNFFSVEFIILLTISLVAYYTVPKKVQWICILCANIVFYAFTGISNSFFIFASAFTTFYGARVIGSLESDFKEKKSSGNFSKADLKAEKEKVKRKKRIVLLFVLLLDFGILASLKYVPFLFFTGPKGLLLPLGISFYTFQSFAYFMDVYNGKYESEQNFFKYFLFISFFPQLIQGPINRYNQLGKQLKETHSFNTENIKRGCLLILFGALKKFVVADVLAKYIAAIFDGAYNNLPGSVIVLGILFYSAYQYADFSGGIDMVLGVAKLFGLDMQPNFRQPYFSVSLAEFWRRWHISLGLWMKDYVFYPLALTKTMQKMGKWCGDHWGKHFARVIPAGFANIIVFLLVGIWHGPKLHFVLWGLYNGLIIALSDMLKPIFTRIMALLKIQTKSLPFYFFQIVRTFIIVNIGWYFDRIEDVQKCFRFLKNTFMHFGNPMMLFKKGSLKYVFAHLPDATPGAVLLVISGLIIFCVSVLKEKQIDVYASLCKKNIFVRLGTVYVLLVLVILSFSFATGSTGFMYAQY